MKNRPVILIVIVILSLMLAACGGAATTEPTTAPAPEPTEAPAAEEPAVEEPAAEPTEAPVEEPAAEPTEAPAAAPDESPLPEPTAEPEPEPEPAQPAASAGPLPDLAGRVIEAVTGNDYVPLNFVDPASGEAMGWEYDAIKEICQRLNCEVDWKVTAWDTMISAVREGQFDVGMDGITITEERAEQVDFSEPYMRAQQFMLVGADEDRFATPEEFAADENLLIGSQAGTTNFYTGVYEVLDGDEANPAHQAV